LALDFPPVCSLSFWIDCRPPLPAFVKGVLEKWTFLDLQISSPKPMTLSMELTNATVHVRANIYFEGRVISHTLIMANGERKTVGVILPGHYHFGTRQSERMEIIDGEAQVLLDGGDKGTSYSAGQAFEIPADSGFTITVTDEPCNYVCSFIGE